jgi:sugar phosphate isomerase/epimerase
MTFAQKLAPRLGIDSQTVFGMPPVEQIRLAAELGCGHVSLARMPPPWQLARFPDWSLLEDMALRRETKAALRDTGLVLALGEGFVIRHQPRDWTAEFDLMAELGAQGVASVCMEPDIDRALDQMALLAAMAAERDMLFLFEFAPPHTFNTLESALAAITAIGRPNARLLIDAMHFFRTGGSIGELSVIDPHMIGHVQLCDAPLAGVSGDDYYREASFERQCPGQGELPLVALLQALKGDVRIGLEVPMQAELAAAEDIRVPIRRVVEASQKLLMSTVEQAPVDDGHHTNHDRRKNRHA